MFFMKHCSKCGAVHSRKGRYCLVCHAAYMRMWRKYRPLSKEARKKDIARSYANVYKRRGKIAIEICEVCGNAAQMHHDDYAQPLNVRWFCRPHHLALHAK